MHYPNEFKAWMTHLLSIEGFPSCNVSLNDKQEFMKSVYSCRQIKKVKEIIKTFSLKCRGLENTDYAKIFVD